MKRFTKAEREEIRKMFDGRCAYCGESLGSRWHADHKEPVMRGVGSYRTGLPAARMENHRIDNMMPACMPCNISKATFSIDRWRLIIAGHVAALNRNQPTYRLAKKYGLIADFDIPVVFYFESDSTSMPSKGDHFKACSRAASSELVRVAFDPNAAPIERCAAARDGECFHAQCPQLKDGEPVKSGRHCPIDNWSDDE